MNYNLRVWVLISLMVMGCSQRIEDTPAYQAACQGSPLQTVEQVNKALEEGYAINREYKCIDKASFLQVAKDKAAWEAANTPEAIAKRKSEFEAQRQARFLEHQAQQAASGKQEKNAAAPERP
jgi:hypothetical protein